MFKQIFWSTNYLDNLNDLIEKNISKQLNTFGKKIN